MTMGEAALIKGLLFTGLAYVLLFVAIFFTIKTAVKAALREYDREKNAAKEISTAEETD